jgi:hypothetical protein
MILRTATILGLLGAVSRVLADVAPDVTTLAEGYNYIAKLPCIDCPYLYQDTSNGENGPWTNRIDDNALLLNISLPFDAAHLSINNAPLLSSSSILPRIYASQVLQDYSHEDLHQKVESNELDTAGPVLGLSYGYSIHHVFNSTALVFRFNVFSAYFPLTNPPTTIDLNDAKQRVIELTLLPRPLHSPGDTGPGWEIVVARLSDRKKTGSRHPMKIMMFEDWDEFGRKGSPSHLIKHFSNFVIAYAASGFWGLSMAILGFIVMFVVVVVGCVLGWDWHNGTSAFEKAQVGKRMVGRAESKGNGSWTDVEKGKGHGRLLSASEGLRAAGSAVAKSD